VVDAVINMVSIVVFVAILVWLMRQSRRSLVGWHSPDGLDFVATARGIDESGTPTKWKVVRARFDPTTNDVSLLPRGARSADLRGTFRLAGRADESATTGMNPRHVGFVVRHADRDVLLRVERASAPCANLTEAVERLGQ
jgi:hypothetical protein